MKSLAISVILLLAFNSKALFAKTSCSEIVELNAWFEHRLTIKLENGHIAEAGTGRHEKPIMPVHLALLQTAFMMSKEVCIESDDYDGNNLTGVKLVK